jgi:hypothetical protein
MAINGTAQWVPLLPIASPESYSELEKARTDFLPLKPAILNGARDDFFNFVCQNNLKKSS